MPSCTSFSEVGIWDRRVPESFLVGFRQGDALAQLAGWASGLGCPEDRNGPLILLDHHLEALLHFGQYGMQIAGHLGFAHVNSSHTSLCAFSPVRSASHPVQRR